MRLTRPSTYAGRCAISRLFVNLSGARPHPHLPRRRAWAGAPVLPAGALSAQLDEIAASGARFVTVSALAERLAEPGGTLVALTFDDGFASMLEHALPALAERDLPATVYCVADRLGGRNDWPSAHPGGFVSDLLSAGEVGKLAEAGIEVGSHGFLHAPLRIAGASNSSRRSSVRRTHSRSCWADPSGRLRFRTALCRRLKVESCSSARTRPCARRGRRLPGRARIFEPSPGSTRTTCAAAGYCAAPSRVRSARTWRRDDWARGLGGPSGRTTQTHESRRLPSGLRPRSRSPRTWQT